MDRKCCFGPADIALPDFRKTDGTSWAVVACDQFTSEPEYWEAADRLVGDKPSVLRLILPEVYLDRREELVPKIHEKMDNYLKNVLKIHKNAMIYLERVQSDGSVRHGIVGAVDLEEYSYDKDSATLIRATEGTVLERIPPRQAVRRGAKLETPHVMLLIDDPDKTVVEPFAELKGTFDKAYDFDLMQGGGHVSGYFIPPKYHAGVESALEALISPEALDRKYHDHGLAPLLFAVGDGNHSLATAKACYEELKAKIGEKALDHPARYALCEVVNLHDKAMTFEPIYRVVFDTDEKILDDLEAYLSALDGQAPAQTIRALWQGKERVILAKKPEKQLPVGTLQAFLDLWLKDHPKSHIDYIHNEDSVRKLVCGPGRIGFLFDGMEKSQLFDSVMRDGVLPRKTFSMGHAQDKRYCLDCRVIVKE